MLRRDSKQTFNTSKDKDPFAGKSTIIVKRDVFNSPADKPTQPQPPVKTPNTKK